MKNKGGRKTYTIENHQPVLWLQLTEGPKHESAGISILVYEQRTRAKIIIKTTMLDGEYKHSAGNEQYPNGVEYPRFDRELLGRGGLERHWCCCC
jgi:hypothetical protein